MLSRRWWEEPLLVVIGMTLCVFAGQQLLAGTDGWVDTFTTVCLFCFGANSAFVGLSGLFLTRRHDG